MNRRTFLNAIGSAAVLPISSRRWSGSMTGRRCRPTDAGWPSPAAWRRLNEAVGGNLIPVDFPLSISQTHPTSPAARLLWERLKNPYYVGDQPGLTETLGWVDAWATKPSAYAVAARNASDISAAVKFAREHNLRLVVKGGGHSYQGTSNAPDSLLIWTRHMHAIEMHDAFVPDGCEHAFQPQAAVTVDAGVIGMQAYQAVTTQGRRYVQGGGCTTVGLAGLVQSGGFGSFSKHYGTAAGSLLQAEVVTADGEIRIANACTHPDLFWALKGGGGGTFGVVSKITLRLHDLPEFFGFAYFKIKAASDDAYRRLIRQFVTFYREHLFNDRWGEQALLHSDNALEIKMVCHGLSTDEAQHVWQPFLDNVARSRHDYTLEGRATVGSIPAHHMWDVEWWKEHWPEVALPRNGSPVIGLLDDVLAHVMQPVLDFDDRSGAGRNNAWWKGDGEQVAWFIWGYESLWLPALLLETSAEERLADALFASSRYSGVALHFNKGLAGAPPDAIAAAQNSAMNPAVLSSFALAILADGQGPSYPGIPGHEPSVAKGRDAAERIDQSTSQLRGLVPDPGAYVSESNYFEQAWQRSYWGSNYRRLTQIKKKYDRDGLFFVHHGVGSEAWSADGFTKM